MAQFRIWLIAALLLVTGIMARPAQAATVTWTGNTNGQWSNGNNWNPSGLPPAGSDIVFAPGASTVFVEMDVDAAMKSVTFEAGGGYFFNLNGKTLTLDGGAGTLSLVGANTFFGPGFITGNVANGSDFDLEGDGGNVTGAFAVSGNFVNTGILLLQGNFASGNSTLDVGGSFTNSGRITLTGSGDADTSTGVLNVGGTFTNQASGSIGLNIVSATPGSFGQINVTGSATLAGTLEINHAGYFENTGDSFPIFTFGSRVDTFTTTNGLNLGNDNSFFPGYHATDLTLTTVRTLVWNGQGDGTTWSDSSNWLPQGVPGAGGDVIFNVAGTFTVNLNVDPVLTRLTMNDAAGKQSIALNGHTLGITETAVLGSSAAFTSEGTIDGSLDSNAEFEPVPLPPGAPARLGTRAGELGGLITVTGNLTQGASGKVTTKIGGTTNGTGQFLYGRIVVGRDLQLNGGTLNAQLTSGYVPTAGDSFEIIKARSISGDFATKNGVGIDLGGGLRLQSQITTDTVGEITTMSYRLIAQSPALTVTANPMTFSEAAGAAASTGTVTRNGATTAALTVNLASNNTNKATVPASVTIPIGQSSANFSIAAVDNSIIDASQSVTITATATNFPAGTQIVTVTNNDVAGITVTPTSGLTTTEAGGTATFTVRLNAQPGANVLIGLTSDNTNEGTVSPASLTFTSANFNTPQTVTVTGVGDEVVDGNQTFHIVTAAATSSDNNFAGSNASDVTVTNQDNDTAGFIVTPTAGLATTEAGGTATFTVRLTSQPSAAVTLPLASNDTGEGTVLPASLTFTAANFSTPQTVTVTGVDDALADGAQSYNIVTGQPTSADQNYSSISAATVPDVTVSNSDNDTPGVLVTPTAGLVTTEAGGTATFTVRLAAQPSANVTLGLSSSNEAEGRLLNSGQAVAGILTLTFTTANWNTPQTVTVRGQNDGVPDANQPYTIITAKPVSTDAGYNALTAGAVPDVALTNTNISPLLNSFSPTSGPVGTPVTLTGVNFTGASAVSFNHVAATITAQTATSISTTVPAGATSGLIRVTTSGGTVASAANFTVTTGGTAPTIGSFTPITGPVGTQVTITGTNFTGTTGAKFNGVTAAFTVLSATQVRATAPAGATTGKISITTGGGTATSAGNFTVTAPPPGVPTINGFSPASATAGQQVTIIGGNFTGATVVKFNNRFATAFTVVSNIYIRATVPAGAVTGKVFVTTPGGTATSPGNFTILFPPAIATFSPTAGLVGTMVTINGSSFNGTTLVRFNNKNTTTFTVVSDTQIQVAVPSGAVTGPVTVTTNLGSNTSKGNFFVLLPPNITTFSPASGPVGTNVTINGTSFTGLRELKFFNNVQPVIVSVTDTQIVARVPAGAATGPLFIRTGLGSMTTRGSFFVTGGAPPRNTVALSSATATAATQSIVLAFGGAVDADSACDASNYTISVNGTTVGVESVRFEASELIVVLGVASTLRPGDAIGIAYSLKGASGSCQINAH